MHLFKIIFIGVAIPILTLAVFKLFIAYAPGKMVGTEDGWLSYLGGYSGGFLAFISAYILFYKQKSLADRCWFTWTIEGNDPEKESSTYLSVLYSDEKQINSYDYRSRMVTEWEKYGVAVVSIKNISVNYARKVEVKLVNRCCLWRCELSPFAHRQESNEISKWHNLSELPSNESFDFVLHINPALLEENKILEFKVYSEGLTGTKNSQDLKLLFKNNTFELSN